jgi:hypothetical protein
MRTPPRDADLSTVDTERVFIFDGGLPMTCTAFLGATPLLTKLVAIALLGRPTINFLKRHSFTLLRKGSGAAD